MQAEVQQALENTYSAAAGKKMERWVHSRVTDLTQRLEQVCTKVCLGLNILSFLVGFV
jgi:FixJ family two-component response regulator